MTNMANRARVLVSLAATILSVAPLAPAMAGTPAKQHLNFTGLWTLAAIDTVLRSGEYDKDNLTPKAQEARAFFGNHSRGFEDEAVGHCVAHGLPWSMTSPARDYLIDIYQTSERITILFEGMEVYRLIHFNKKEVPVNFTSGTWGYSLAHWEGDTLVIITKGLSAKNPFGNNQRSDKAVVTERWRMVQDAKYGKALDIEIIDDDPEVFIKPSRGHELMVRAPADAVLLPYGCTESLWNEYVERRLAEIGSDEKK
jgi:hypothetical protein